MPKPPLEKEIQNSICEYLELKRLFFWRQNTTPVYDTTRKAFRSMPKYSLKGVADIIVIKNGATIFLEVKRPKGKQSEDQIEFERLSKKNGAQYYVVTSLDDVMKIL
jgi:hypothetical protein